MTTKKEYLIYKLSDEMKSCIRIDAELFKKLDVKRGLRDVTGNGVLTGLTEISESVPDFRKRRPFYEEANHECCRHKYQ